MLFEKNNIKGLMQELLIHLSDKERFIIEHRFAINNCGKKTLEELGMHFGITRERVRQIEETALKKLQRRNINTQIQTLTLTSKAILETAGGIMSDEAFKQTALAQIPSFNAEKLHELHLAAILDKDTHFRSNTIQMRAFWYLSTWNKVQIEQIAQKAYKYIEKNGDLISIDALFDRMKNDKESQISKSCLKNILAIHKEIAINGTELSLTHWRHIHPKTLKDKISFALNQEKNPMHFKEVTEKIKKMTIDSKKIKTPAIHNEMIRGDEFVLIGRGIYALKSWGYKNGTVMDVIEDVMSDGKTRSRDQIQNEVMKQRQVKPVTIQLNLRRNKNITRTGRDGYTMKKTK